MEVDASKLPPVVYLTMDSLQEGIGASQVLAYVERLARLGVSIELHSFEKRTPASEMQERLRCAGVDWTPHDFGAFGTIGGVRRVAVGASALRGAKLVHARSDLAAASAIASRCPTWLWDLRSLWPDQRIDLGTLRAGSGLERVLRRIERTAAHRSTSVVTLTAAVLPVLDERYGGISAKATVIPTCVDTDLFEVTPMPAGRRRFLLSGTVNRYYDVPAMTRLVAGAKQRDDVEFRLLSPDVTSWEKQLAPLIDSRGAVCHDQMPGELAACHVGLSVCRTDVNVSRTASMPTKIAEFLASGRPVVVNPGLGDADRLITEHAAGVVLYGSSDAQVAAALEELDNLLNDEKTPERCRGLALEHFDLDNAVRALVGVYHRMAA